MNKTNQDIEYNLIVNNNNFLDKINKKSIMIPSF